MLNKYLDLLQHATEAMTSVGKTGAGAAEYFQAVGYEFLVIGLGFLYLVGIVLLVAGPVLVFYHGVFKAGFASKKLKEMYMIAEEYVNASNQCNELQYDFANDGKKCRVENFEKLCECIGQYYKAFSKDVGYGMVPGDTMEEKKCFLRETKHPHDFSCGLPRLFGIYGWSFESSEYSRITKWNLFADIAAPGEESSIFTGHHQAHSFMTLKFSRQNVYRSWLRRWSYMQSLCFHCVLCSSRLSKFRMREGEIFSLSFFYKFLPNSFDDSPNGAIFVLEKHK